VPTSSGDVLLAEYSHAAESQRALVDVRFRLLAFIPTVTGVAIAALKDLSPARFPVAVLGLLVTLGVVMYEVRNSQLHDAAAHAVSQIAKQLGLPRYPRPQRSRLFGVVPVWHDASLGVIYGASAAAWAGLLAYSANGWMRERSWAVAAVALLLGVGVCCEIVRINEATKAELNSSAPRHDEYPDPRG
jgi:hypothetical protein